MYTCICFSIISATTTQQLPPVAPLASPFARQLNHDRTGQVLLALDITIPCLSCCHHRLSVRDHQTQQQIKRRRNIHVLLCTCFHKRQTKHVGQPLTIHGGDLPGLGPTIDFIAHQYNVDFLVGRFCLGLVKPFLTILKGQGVRDVVHEQNPRRLSVKRGGNALKTFLPRRVPHQYREPLLVDGHGGDSIVESDGGDEIGGKHVVGIPGQEGCFADGGIPNDDQVDGRCWVAFGVRSRPFRHGGCWSVVGEGGESVGGVWGGSRELLGLDNCLAFVHDKRPRGEKCRSHWRVNCVYVVLNVGGEGSIFVGKSFFSPGKFSLNLSFAVFPSIFRI